MVGDVLGVKRNMDAVETAILEAIRQVPPPPAPQETKINPVCLRLSDMLEELSGREKAEAEIKLLQTMFDIKYKKE